MKNLTKLEYLYFDKNDPDAMCIFNDPNSQINGMKFKRSKLEELQKLASEEEFHFLKNEGIYFLISEESIYIGQSRNGIDRIKEHNRLKEFWEYAILFTTNNKSWTKTAIDYFEYSFINKFKNIADYALENSDERKREPNLRLFDKPTIIQAIREIEFYLNTQGIRTKNREKEENKETKEFANITNDAVLIYDGQYFYLKKGSKLQYPKETVAKHKDGMKLYNRIKNRIDNLKQENKIDGNLKLLIDLEVKKPSTAAQLCTGNSVNGWDYFIGVKKIR